MLSILRALKKLIFATALGRNTVFFFHFADGETEAEEVTWINKATQLENGRARIKANLPTPEIELLTTEAVDVVLY